jgi:fructokinase
MNDVLAAIGEALIDLIPDRSGCSFDEVTAFSPKVGGAPANVCAAFSRLGGRSRMITQLGDDPFGHKIIRELKETGVDTGRISLTDKANTALAFVSLDREGGRTFSFYRKPSADMLLTPESIKEEYFDEVFALHFCSVSLGNFPMKEANRRAIEIMHKKGGMVSFDPNLRFDLWESREALKSAIDEFIPMSDIVKLSEEEIEFVAGCDNKAMAAHYMFEQGVKLVLVTSGCKGAYAFTRKANAYSPALKVSAIDTTGAGDGFAGAFLWALKNVRRDDGALEDISQDTLTECLTFANKFCGLSVTKKGAIASYPTADEMTNKIAL